MRYKKKLRGKNIYLRNLEMSDCTSFYRDWLNDPVTNRFLEVRWKKQTINKLKKFVKHMNSSKNNFHAGIFLLNNDQHIGTIKLGNIDYNHLSAEIGCLLGNKNMQNLGYTTEAIKLMCSFAFKKLNLKYLFSHVYSNNISSQKVFLKNYFIKSGFFKKKVVFKKKRVNIIYFERYN